jgi:predicted dienelactone hydrolase
MQLPSHALIGAAANLSTIINPSPVLSFSPVMLPSQDRLVDLQLRVSVPSTIATDRGRYHNRLPVVLFSHGHGWSNWLSSLDGYAPLSEFWAAHGLVVIQPTHQDSAFLGLNDTNDDMFYESRAEDMLRILDHVDEIEAAVPAIKGRLDWDSVAVAGHSFGAWTTSMILGAQNTDPRDGTKVSVPRRRNIKAGVVMAGTGNGGDDLSENGRSMLPFYGPDFSKMRTPALVVIGEEDVSEHLTVRGADWHADPYTLSPGPKHLFTVRGGYHGLGGVSGWDAAENAEDESPERLGTVQRVTLAYLRSQLYKGDKSWAKVSKELVNLEQLGDIQSK